MNGLTLSVLQDVASGLPYGAVGVGGGSGGVNAIPFVTNPGYANPQGNTSETYYYTARDAFHTESSTRTDIAINYDYAVGVGSRQADLFFQAQILNVFNAFDLCGCGSTVFSNGGAAAMNTIGQTVTAVAAFQPVHDHACRRHQLDQGGELRHTAEPLRIHVAADAAIVLRCQVLECSSVWCRARLESA